MLPIFGAPVHVGDEIPGTLTYDADAIGEIAEPGLETFNPAGAPRAARRRRCRGAPRRSPAS
jgi:hypothetical protein